MTVRRHLTDLYQTGRELEFAEGEKPVLVSELDDDGNVVYDPETTKPRLVPQLDEYGDVVTEPEFVEKVWVAKLTILDHKAAVRRADAKKAEVLIAARNREGEEWQSAVGMVDDVCHGDREMMIDFLVTDRVAQRQEAIGAEIEGEEVDGPDGPEPSEWKKDNYLQGLYDTWNGIGTDTPGLKVRYAQNAEDPEAKRVFEEITRFISLVDERLEEERVEVRADLADADADTLRIRIAEMHLESRSNQVFWEEFCACRVYLGLRRAEKHSAYYLQGRDDVAKLHPSVAEQVLAAIEELAVDVTEGKDLPATRITSR